MEEPPLPKQALARIKAAELEAGADLLNGLAAFWHGIGMSTKALREHDPAELNEHDVARITGLSVASVRRWRLLRQGPKYIKIGAAVRYRPEDVAAWLETRPTGGGQ